MAPPALPQEAFPSLCLLILYNISWCLMYPTYWLTNKLLSLFISTSRERRRRGWEEPCYEHYIIITLGSPLLLVLVLATLPMCMFGLLIWAPLQRWRSQLRYSTNLKYFTKPSGIMHGHRSKERDDHVCNIDDNGDDADSISVSQIKSASSATVVHVHVHTDNVTPPNNATVNNVAKDNCYSGSLGDTCFGHEKLSRCLTSKTIDKDENDTSLDACQHERKFTVVTANVCLMPEFIARLNNLYNTQWRAKTIGSRLIGSHTGGDDKSTLLQGERRTYLDHSPSSNDENYGAITNSHYDPSHGCHSRNNVICDVENQKLAENVKSDSKSLNKARDKEGHGIGDLDNSKSQEWTDDQKNSNVNNDNTKNSDPKFLVSTHFPEDTDFLCLQEVFERRASQTLVPALHRRYPYIVHDVGVYFRKGQSVLNSGLLLASVYPIEGAVFKCFQRCSGVDRMASKGLLMVKVNLGKSKTGQKLVGYIANTHTQAHQGTKNVRSHQLDNILEWTEDFVQQNHDPEESILFDLLCGDFNFDNMSSGDKKFYTHPLMRKYQDPCRLRPGLDRSWTLGTEMYQKQLYVEPEEFKEMLSESDPEKLAVYLEDVIIDEDDTANDVRLPRSNGRRRIDYLLYCTDHMETSGRMGVVEYRYITQLASLTDHVPLSMAFTVN